jgi:poly-beta-1,6-N-acetyl-D-glucosamine synthase
MLFNIIFQHLHTIVPAIFAFAFMVQLFYYWFYYSRLAFYKQKSDHTGLEPVSVVIAAHNEAHNLEKNLPAILEQDYPDFEVIVVNDSSHDETKDVLTVLSQKYHHLKVLNITQSVTFFKSKKFPLSVGIKSAKNDMLLLTDADCQPASDLWIRQMRSCYGHNTEIVLGYSPYEKRKGLLNLLIQYDTFQVALQYFSFALAGKPYMGVGRNLSYKKSLFYKHKGFINHYHIRSGDDDLFIGTSATKANTNIQIEPSAHVYSAPKTTFSAWLTQKRRHFTTGKYYKPVIKFLLSFQAFSGVLYYLSAVYLIAMHFLWPYVLAAHGFRLASRMLLFAFASEKLNQKKLYLTSPLLDPFFTFFNPLLLLSGLVIKSKKWK